MTILIYLFLLLSYLAFLSSYVPPAPDPTAPPAANPLPSASASSSPGEIPVRTWLGGAICAVSRAGLPRASCKLAVVEREVGAFGCGLVVAG